MHILLLVDQVNYGKQVKNVNSMQETWCYHLWVLDSETKISLHLYTFYIKATV